MYIENLGKRADSKTPLSNHYSLQVKEATIILFSSKQTNLCSNEADNLCLISFVWQYLSLHITVDDKNKCIKSWNLNV